MVLANEQTQKAIHSHHGFEFIVNDRMIETAAVQLLKTLKHSDSCAEECLSSHCRSQPHVQLCVKHCITAHFCHSARSLCSQDQCVPYITTVPVDVCSTFLDSLFMLPQPQWRSRQAIFLTLRGPSTLNPLLCPVAYGCGPCSLS